MWVSYMQTIELLPVEDDEQYVSHVTLLILGWLLVTLIVAAILALVAL
jgi:hypothetical protein